MSDFMDFDPSSGSGFAPADGHGTAGEGDVVGSPPGWKDVIVDDSGDVPKAREIKEGHVNVKGVEMPEDVYDTLSGKDREDEDDEPFPLSKATRLELAHQALAKTDPDHMGRTLDVADMAGLDFDLVRGDPGGIEAGVLGAVDWDDLPNIAPSTAAFLSDPLMMAIVKDDVANLSRREQYLRHISAMSRASFDPIAVEDYYEDGGPEPVGVIEAWWGTGVEFGKSAIRSFANTTAGVLAQYAHTQMQNALNAGWTHEEWWEFEKTGVKPDQEELIRRRMGKMGEAPEDRRWAARALAEGGISHRYNDIPLNTGLARIAYKASRWLEEKTLESPYSPRNWAVLQMDRDFYRRVHLTGGVPRFVSDFTQGLGSLAWAMTATALGGAELGSLAMVNLIAGQKYEQFLEDNPDMHFMDRARFARASMWDGLLQGQLEMIAVGKALKLWRPQTLMGTRAKALFSVMLTEGVTEYSQSYVEKLTEMWAYSSADTLFEVRDFFSTVLTWQFQQDALYQGILGMLTAGAVSTPSLFIGGDPHFRSQDPKTDLVTNIRETLNQLRMTKRSKTAVTEYVAQLVKDRVLPERFFIRAKDVATLFQESTDPNQDAAEWLEAYGIDWAEYDAAIEIDGQVAVDGRLLGKIALDERAADTFVGDDTSALTISPVEKEGLDLVRQLTETEDTELAPAEKEQLEALFQEVMATHESTAPHREAFVGQVLAAYGKGLRRGQAEKYAAILDAVAHTWAQNTGRPATERWAKWGITVKKSTPEEVGVPGKETASPQSRPVTPEVMEVLENNLKLFGESGLRELAKARGWDLSGVEGEIKEIGKKLAQAVDQDVDVDQDGQEKPGALKRFFHRVFGQGQEDDPERIERLRNRTREEKRAAFDAIEPVVLSGDEVPARNEGEKFTAYRRRVIAWAKTNGVTGGVENGETRWEIGVLPAGLKSALAHKAAEKKVQIVAKIPDLLHKAVYLRSQGDEKGRPLVDHIFAAKIDYAGAPFVVGLVVKEDVNGRRFYDHELSEIEKLDRGPASAGAASPGGEVGRPDTHRASVMNIVREEIGVNSDADFFHATEAGDLRGAIQLGEAETIIHLFEKRDLSTVIHEIGHLLRRELGTLVGEESSPEWVAEGWRAVHDLVGATVGQEWTVEQEEVFARAFEAYVLEGKAPSQTLRQVFHTLRRWMLNIYRTMANLDVELNDEVRTVFDRMLATELEIQEAKAGVQAKPLLDEGQGDTEYTKQIRRVDAAMEKAIQARVEIERRKLEPGWEREAKREAAEHPTQKHLDAIIEAGGIDIDSLGFDLDAKVTTQIRNKRVGRPILVKDSGVEALSLLETLSVPDVYALVDYLAGIPSKTDLTAQIRAEIEGEWLASYDPEVEVLGEEYEDLLDMEAELLEKALTETGAEVRATAKTGRVRGKSVKQYVKDRTRQMRVDRLLTFDVNTVKAVIRREARESRRAYNEGRMDAALEHKQKHRLAVAELKAKMKAKEQARKIIVRAKKAARSKSVDWHWAEQIRNLVTKYGIGKTMQPQRLEELPSLREFLSDKSDLFEGDLIDQVPDWILGGVDVPYGKMTVGQQEELDRVIQMLAKRGRSEKILLGLDGQTEIATVVKESMATMKDLKLKKHLTERQRATFLGKASNWVKQFKAELGMPEFLLRSADGFRQGVDKLSGPLDRYVVQPLAKARESELKVWETLDEKIRTVMAKIEISDKYFRLENVPLPHDVSRHWGGMWTREKVIAVALNMGNEGNLKALRRGYGWTDEHLAMITEQVTAEEWTAIQEVWDLVDEVFPMVDEAHFTLNGVKLKKVQAQELTTRHGQTLRGGYYPLIFDRRFSQRAAKNQEKDDLLNRVEAIHQSPNPRSGMTKERKGGTLPPRLALSALHKHLWDSVHYATHAVPTRDAYRILSDPTFREMFIDRFGEHAYDQFKPWLRYIARPERGMGDAFEDAMNKLRSNATVAILGLNAQVAIKQLGSLSGTAHEVGAWRTIRALASGARHKKKLIQFVDDRSTFMKHRASNIDRDIKAALDRYNPVKKTYRVMGKEMTWDDFRNWCFVGIRAMDAVASYPSWKAAYDKAMEENWDEDKAIVYADDVNRNTQPSANPMDLALIQRTEGMKRFFSMFMTFTLLFYNRQAYKIRGVREGRISKKDFANHVFYEWFLAPAMTSLALSLIKSGDLPEEEEVAADMIGFWLSGVPVIRNVVGSFRYFGRGVSETPALQGLEDALDGTRHMGMLLYDVLNGDGLDEKRAGRMLHKYFHAAGYFFGVPTRAVSKFAAGVDAYVHDESDNPLQPLFGRPPKED